MIVPPSSGSTNAAGSTSALQRLAQFANNQGVKALDYTADDANGVLAKAKGLFDQAGSYLSEKIDCPLLELNALKADAEANAAGPMVSGKGSAGFEKDKPGGKLERNRAIEVEGDLWSKQKTAYQIGDKENNLIVGQISAEAKSGYSYDPAKQERFFGAKGKAEVVVLKGKLTGEKAHGLLGGELEGEALAARVSGKLGAEWDEKGGKRLAAEVGAEAVLVSGKAKGQIKVTPKTLWDNSCNLVAEGSKYCNAPEWLDHGLVAGVQGEAGIGAAAKAEGAIGKLEEGWWGVKGGAKAGAGPMGGIKAFFGFI